MVSFFYIYPFILHSYTPRGLKWPSVWLAIYSICNDYLRHLINFVLHYCCSTVGCVMLRIVKMGETDLKFLLTRSPSFFYTKHIPIFVANMREVICTEALVRALNMQIKDLI